MSQNLHGPMANLAVQDVYNKWSAASCQGASLLVCWCCLSEQDLSVVVAFMLLPQYCLSELPHTLVNQHWSVSGI